jgi:4-hydroxybenzoyl-CoA thioesterase
MAKVSKIERNFRVRFAQIDGARVIFFPRYLEMIAETFPEVAMNEFPFELAIRFLQPNRLGDDIKMCLEQSADGWAVSGRMDGECFSVALHGQDKGDEPERYQGEFASFETGEFTIQGWMCGPSGQLHLSRYYELVNYTVERWFDASLGMTFSDLHVARNLGVPTVQLDTRCQRLPASGDVVSIGLRPLSVGASAVHLLTRLASAGETLLETRQVIVFVELSDKKIRSTEMPGALRNRLVEQLATMRSE